VHIQVCTVKQIWGRSMFVLAILETFLVFVCIVVLGPTAALMHGYLGTRLAAGRVIQVGFVNNC